MRSTTRSRSTRSNRWYDACSPLRSDRFISPAIRSDPAPARAEGKAARDRCPRSSHAGWTPPEHRPDPIELLQRDDIDRLPELLPIRYARMAETPFTFYRGAASIMASDLQSTPDSGIPTQICGDAHLSNFGAYASPERRFVFDVNDFDETTAGGAWEWDLKRLATSVELAGRSIHLRDRETAAAVRACLESYRVRMQQYAQMRVLDIWYSRLDERLLQQAIGEAEARECVAGELHEPSQSAQHLYPKLVAEADGRPHIADKPPLVFHPEDDPEFVPTIESTFAHYRRSLPVDRRILFDRFSFADAAYKVVGVGSVGTRCCVALFSAGNVDPLFLQIKEARASVYERYRKKSAFKDHGERVVSGQRLMQAATDLFLGWARGDDGRTYYVRQLRDMKTGADIERMNALELRRYGGLCGWALARAHAKASGAPAKIAGYLGKGDAFDEAVGAFAHGYAAQNERDHAALLQAIADKRIVAATST
jgi:uncharacterized protein (DUF2252 family)